MFSNFNLSIIDNCTLCQRAAEQLWVTGDPVNSKTENPGSSLKGQRSGCETTLVILVCELLRGSYYGWEHPVNNLMMCSMMDVLLWVWMGLCQMWGKGSFRAKQWNTREQEETETKPEHRSVPSSFLCFSSEKQVGVINEQKVPVSIVSEDSRCSPVTEHLPSVYESLGSIFNTEQSHV